MIQINSGNVAVVVIGFLVFWLLSSLHGALCESLRNVPGPWQAKFSPLWRLGIVWKGNAHEEYCKLHQKYGPMVRTAPNVVDVSDPAAIPVIYGINSKFLKACVPRWGFEHDYVSNW